ncbi:SNF2 family N-terminal domain-domain-containing protein [Clohesyomyces aquaticus]|uniref:SNF2 family N-terminal domain-domain-containing protein n=1 Tax=Clohesyomyces aquaticus TaxID=1231657 RepID=A0A1Y1ZVE3_9PLEO|nr:SNF2 family N-terminal domain-domain-containing protein [Clohesyomyces aquaticus]
MFSNWTDPFPETDAAYRGGSNDIFRAGPADAFAQEWLSPMELAQFLVTPTRQADVLVNGNRPGRPAEVGGQVAPQPSIAPYLDLQPTAGGLAQELFGIDEVDDSGMPRSEAITKLLENIQPDDEIPKERREQTPRAMCSSLMEHQKLGLSWLKKMEQSASKGGILADDMGLGKTVQALALILARPSDDPICKTTLIIAPVALMRQWEKEIQRHVHPSMRLKVYIYHQGGKKADFNTLRQYDVVLTTFGCLSTEEKRIESFEESSRDLNEQNTGTRRKPRDRLSLIGPECYWYRVILDEAQCIKNKGTLTAKGAFRIRARHRLCMTGTPMMNSIDELYPQIRFLGIKPYNDWARFRTDISQQLKAGQDWRRERGVTRVHALIKSIMLRRTKQTILDGEPICNIPPKSIEPASVEFSDEEHELYKAIEGKSQLQFNKYLKAGTVVNNYASVLLLLLRLRQACCHPHLIKDLGVQVSTEGIDEEELLNRAQQLKDDVVARLKESMGFECPICFDATQNPTIFMPCGHTSCGECFQKLIDPARAVQEGREDGSAAKCPHCRGLLSANKITDYEHFCKVFCPEKLPDKLVISQANSEENSESDSDEEEDEGDDLDGFIVADDAEDDDDYFETPAPKAEDGEKKKDKRASKGKGKGKKRIKEKKTLAQLKKESLRNKAAKKKYLRRLRKDWEPSAKIEKTLQLLYEIHENDPTEKTLIFSQFTSLLDLLEVPLQDRNVKYQRYDGSMKPDDRAAAVNDFMDRPDQKVMLISLKAGNAGLNLSKANHVIVLDPFWNPFIEDQAVDRAHRMPQQREVHVHRLLVPETVEDRIVTLQEQKREVISAALDENVGKSISRLGVAELKYLFGL